jgi:hypothetical protein
MFDIIHIDLLFNLLDKELYLPIKFLKARMLLKIINLLSEQIN